MTHSGEGTSSHSAPVTTYAKLHDESMPHNHDETPDDSASTLPPGYDDYDPDEIVHWQEIRQLFQKHLHIGRTFFFENYAPLLEDDLKYKGARRAKKSAYMLYHEVVELIEEFKQHGFHDAFGSA